MTTVDITMFYDAAEVRAEMARIAEQERLRGRTLTADEVVDLHRDIEPEEGRTE